VHSEFLRPLFRELNEGDYRYAVLRNHEGLPDSIPGTDIDILISPSAVSSFDALITRLCLETGWVSLRVTNKDFRIRNHVLSNLDQTGQVEFVVLDVMSAIGWNGFTAWPADQILDYSSLAGEICTLSKQAEAAVTTITSLAYAGLFKKKQYAHSARSAAEEKNSDYQKLLSKALGSETASKLNELIASDASGSIDTASLLVRNGLKKVARRRLPRNTRDSLWTIKFRLGRLLSPPGMLIAVIGTDGSGKSTLIKRLETRLRPVFGSTTSAHLRPRFLPDISSISGAKSSASPNQTTTHTRSPGAIGSLLRWSYYWIDYLVGYQLVFRPKMAKKSAIVIDRYYYDFEFDHGQKNVKLPGWLVRGMQKLLPTPDVVVHVDTDTQTVLKRRGIEVDEKEIDRQRIALRTIGSRLKNGGTIDGSQSPDAVADQAIALIVKILALSS
jgi:thymidylate kinase